MEACSHRCSQCSWELSEDNYCVRCHIQYDGGAVPSQDVPEGGGSDVDSDMNEPESNLTGFVVSDDDVEYDDDEVPHTFARENRRFMVDDSDVESLPSVFSSTRSHSPPTAGTIEISDGRCRCIDIQA